MSVEGEPTNTDDPAAKPADPAAKPAKPADPAAKPADPAAKPADPAAKPADPAAKPADPAAKPADPVAKPVEFRFEAPEGVVFDETRLGEFSALAKEIGLDQVGAQKLVSWEAKRLAAAADAHLATVSGWLEQVKADKVLGGAGHEAAIAVARKAIDLGPPGLKQLLNDTGLGNHPDVVRWAHSIGSKLSEDKHELGSPGVAPKSAAQVLYGDKP